MNIKTKRALINSEYQRMDAPRVRIGEQINLEKYPGLTVQDVESA
jgi:hypothetical protein